MKEYCSVADQACIAAGNFAFAVNAGCTCFRCGLKVCRNCSSIRQYNRHGRVRLCNNCQVEIDGNDKIVMARLHKLCGA
jgi:hypothetical protein